MNAVQPIRDPAMIEEIKGYLRRKRERDWFLFVLGINIGLRITDMLGLKVRDVRGKSQIRIKERKTGKTKLIEINPKLKRAIQEYIRDKSDDEYLFPSRQRDRHGRPKPITREMAYRILKEAASRYNLDHIGCHTLRKTFGYHFYLKEKNVAMLMEIFNHSHESITLRYIGINQDEIRKAMNRFGL
jgi:integrase